MGDEIIACLIGSPGTNSDHHQTSTSQQGCSPQDQSSLIPTSLESTAPPGELPPMTGSSERKLTPGQLLDSDFQNQDMNVARKNSIKEFHRRSAETKGLLVAPPGQR